MSGPMASISTSAWRRSPVHPGADGSDCGWEKGADRRRGRLPGKRAILEGTAPGLKARGLEVEPSLAIGDGALGFWKAYVRSGPTTQEQRCWVHKTANVLDKLPKGTQPKAKAAYMRSTKPRPRLMLTRRSISSRRPTRQSIPKRSNAWRKTEDAAHVLQLPSRALAAHPHDESDRADVRYSATANGEDQRKWEPRGLPDDGIQADGRVPQGVGECSTDHPTSRP